MTDGPATIVLDHAQVAERLELFMDHALTPAEADAVQNHLATCEVCRRRYAMARSFEHRIKATLRADGPRIEVWNSIVRDLRGERRPQVVWMHGRLRGSMVVGWWRIVVPIIALGLGLTVFVLTGPSRVPSGSTASHLAEIPIRELKDWITAHRPLDFAETDPRRLQEWFAKRVSFVPPLPPQSTENFRLEGGRLCHFFDRYIAA